MTMQLLGKEQDESSDDEAVTERWQQYVNAFVSVSSIDRSFVTTLTLATGGLVHRTRNPLEVEASVPTEVNRIIRLETLIYVDIRSLRSLPFDMSMKPDVLARDGLEIKVCVRTYRLFFVSGSEDYLVRFRSGKEYAAAVTGAKNSMARQRRWLEKNPLLKGDNK
jgi:paired amphipathic helix protein Sin3a